MPQNPYLQKLPRGIRDNLYSVPPQCLVYLMSLIMRPLNYSVPHMMQADSLPDWLTGWLLAPRECWRQLWNNDASVHTVTCKLFHYKCHHWCFLFLKTDWKRAPWLTTIQKKNFSSRFTNKCFSAKTHTQILCIYIYIYIYIYIEPAVVMQFLSLKSNIILIVWLYYIFIIVWLNFTWVFVSLFYLL